MESRIYCLLFTTFNWHVIWVQGILFEDEWGVYVVLRVDDDVKCHFAILDRQTLDLFLFLEAGAEDCLVRSVKILVVTLRP